MTKLPVRQLVNEKARSNAPAGAVVAIAALLGVAGGLSAGGALGRADHVVAGIARTITQPTAALELSGQVFGWSAASVVVILWLGRRFSLAVARLRRDRSVTSNVDSSIRSTLHRLTSISYRTGGLYGP